MTPSSADVRSLERLQQFHAALAEFARRFGQRVSALEVQHSRACDFIERRHTALGSRVADLDEFLSTADEETDTWEIEQELEEAQSELEEALECEIRANAARTRYHQQAARIRALLQSGIPQGRSLLQRKIENLHEVLAIPLPETSSGRGSMAARIVMADAARPSAEARA